jgi:hypothetical protein
VKRFTLTNTTLFESEPNVKVGVNIAFLLLLKEIRYGRNDYDGIDKKTK